MLADVLGWATYTQTLKHTQIHISHNHRNIHIADISPNKAFRLVKMVNTHESLTLSLKGLQRGLFNNRKTEQKLTRNENYRHFHQ